MLFLKGLKQYAKPFRQIHYKSNISWSFILWILLFLLLIAVIASCSANNKFSYKQIPFIEMTSESLWRFSPDLFLYTGNYQAAIVTVSKISNSGKEYEDTYTYNSEKGFLTSMRLYSDGDYYITEYSYGKSKLISEIRYIDTADKRVLNLYSYEYTNEKIPIVEVIDENKNDIRSFIIISKKDEITIQQINNSKEMEMEYLYKYQNGKIISITSKDIIKTIFKTEIYYDNNIITKNELFDETNGTHRLLTKKEYHYDSDGKLIGLIQTNKASTDSPEIYKIVFKNHDSHGNWTTSESDSGRIYQREIIYLTKQ